MNQILVVILIAISLSMDAFSLSLIYGTSIIKKTTKIYLSISVGIFHFFMPLLGYKFGSLIENNIPISLSIIAAILLIVLGIQMLLEKSEEEKKIKTLSIIEILLFSFSVSIDSFMTGIGIKSIYEEIFIVSLIFSLTSALWTYVGLNIGTILNKKFGSTATKLGGITLIIIGIITILKYK